MLQNCVSFTWTILTLGQKQHLNNVHLDNNVTWTIMWIGQCSLGQYSLGQKSTWTIFTWTKIATPCYFSRFLRNWSQILWSLYWFLCHSESLNQLKNQLTIYFSIRSMHIFSKIDKICSYCALRFHLLRL